MILDLFQYRLCGAEERDQLETKARLVARVCSKPIYVFRELSAYLTEQRIVVPGYSTLQDMIGSALTAEQNRLLTLVDQQLAAQEKTALQHLLADTAGLYAITRLKQEPKDFTLGEIKDEIKRGQQLCPLYRRAKQLLPLLDISNESIKYYASLVTYYSVFRLKQLDEQLVTVYLLCFIYHRYQRLNDNLLKSFLYKISGYLDEAKTAAKEQVYAYQLESNLHLQKAGQVLKLFTDETIAAATPFQDIRTQAFTIFDRQQLATVADRLTTNASFDETAFQWQHLDRLAPQFKRNVRLILTSVELVAAQTAHPLLEAVHCLKQLFQTGKSLQQADPTTLPTRFIPEPTKRYLYAQDAQGQKHLLLNRYEFLVYRLLRNSLEAGEIFCRASVQFRSFEEDLLDDQQWQKKETLLITTGLTSLQQAGQAHLAALEQTLEERLTQVNQRIAAGENEHFQRKARGQSSQ